MQDDQESLSPAEQSLIEEHLDFYRSLDDATRSPDTEAQRHFVAVCRARAKAETDHELAYVKYRMLEAQQRRETEIDHEQIDMEHGQGVPRTGWFTDKDWKENRRRYP